MSCEDEVKRVEKSEQGGRAARGNLTKLRGQPDHAWGGFMS